VVNAIYRVRRVMMLKKKDESKKEELLIRAMVKEEMDERRKFFVFDCPYCKHETIATQDYDRGRGGIARGKQGCTFPPYREWEDVRCLICGKLFKKTAGWNEV
jgi:ribosomal protein S27E